MNSSIIDNNNTVNYNDWQQPYYSIFCPALALLAFCALLLNAYILTAIRWMHRPLGMHTALCLSLAANDAVTSAFMILSLVFNAWMPKVLNLNIPQCLALCIEIIKQGGLTSSVLHILALALNQYGGIVYTMKHRRLITGRVKMVTLVTLWVVPSLCFLLFNVSLPNQLLRSYKCLNVAMFGRFSYRIILTQFFFIPMFVTFALYVRIAMLLYGKQASNLAYQQSIKHTSNGNVLIASEPDSNASQDANMIKYNSVPRKHYGQDSQSSQGAQRKFLVTLMLMTGSFLMGWLPNTIVFISICPNCPLGFMSAAYPKLVFTIFLASNCLITFKLFLNPLIYASRLLDLRFALWQMHVTRWNSRKLDLHKHPLPKKFQPLISHSKFNDAINRKRMMTLVEQRKLLSENTSNISTGKGIKETELETTALLRSTGSSETNDIINKHQPNDVINDVVAF